MENAKRPLMIGGGILLTVVLGIGGFFLYQKIAAVHQENLGSLEGFGVKVIPVRQGSEAVTFGEDGQLQIPPDIQEKELSPSEKVIISLSKEKEALMGELAVAQERVAELEAELTLLKDYRNENERYAPLPMRAERQRALDNLRAYLAGSPDADRFDDFQLRAMALGAANVYREMLIKYRLAFSEEQKDELIKRHLPAFSFCIGDGIGFVANGAVERKRLIQYLESGDDSNLSSELKEDLDTIIKPCRQILTERANRLIAG